MILYYSATGNSRYAAQALRSLTGDGCIDLLPYLRSRSRGPISSQRPFVFVLPTYAWRIPRMAAEWVERAELQGSRQAYFVLTCGEEAGNAAAYLKRLCRQKGLQFCGMAAVPMPDNYLILFPSPAQEEIDAAMGKAVPLLKRIAALLVEGEPLPEQEASLLDKLKSGPVNRLFYTFFVTRPGFYATSACVGCGQCASLCPKNNIVMQGGRPQWGTDCTHCTACLNLCPAAAVEYRKKTQGKPRYHCGEVWRQDKQ